MVRSVARGALLTAGSEIYRAGQDGALYLVHEQQSSDKIRQRFENLRRHHESAVKRQVREHLKKIAL